MSNLGPNQNVVAGVKRKITQTAINTSVQNAKMIKVLNDFVQDTSSAQMWKIAEGDDFINVKTREVIAKATELTNNEIVYDLLGGEKYVLLNTARFTFKIIAQKKNGDAWITVPDNEILVVKPGAIMDLLNRNLECSLIHPGEIVDNKIINIKQDKTTHISPYDIQRKYDKLYVEKELESDMHICKEWTYKHAFTNNTDTHADYRPGKADSIYTARAVEKKTSFPDGSLLKKCKKFGDELKFGKKYTMHGSIMNPIFQTTLLPSRHGMRIKMTLGRDEDHMEFFEDYTQLAKDTAPSVYRFKLEKTGANKVQARYEVATLTTSAFEKYNQLFAGGKAVEVAQFMVHNHSHRTIEANSTEIQNLELPNTSNVPVYTGWQIKSRTNYDHKSSRDSWMDNSFLRYVKKMQFQGTEQANTGIREGTSTIDFDEDLDLEMLYRQQKRWFLGREHQSMSDQKPAYGILNGTTSEVYDNQGENKADFMKLAAKRHTNPFILEFDQSRGKYGADQRHSSVANLAIKTSLQFRTPIPVASEVVITSAYRGKYVQRKNTNGTLDMNFLQVDISSNLL